MADQIFTVDQLLDLTGGRIGVTDSYCPECGPGRRSPHNRTRKVLRIWDNGDGFMSFNCERCGIEGYATDRAAKARKRPPVQSAPAPDTSDREKVARFLWRISDAAKGTPVETYLRGRGCWIENDNCRFLPSRGDHPPAMLLRFGMGGMVTGVHLTSLARDGRGKAGTDKDKRMIGPSRGQPIVVHDNPERGELIIAEGYEDAASWACVTGWTCWAAGSAKRIPHIIALASQFEKRFVSFDRDDDTIGDGRKALLRAKEIDPALIPIDVAKMFGLAEGADANKVLLRHGADALLGCLIRAEAQYDLIAGRIGPEAFSRRVAEACANL